MTRINTSLIITLFLLFIYSAVCSAGGIPLTTDDQLNTAINSNDALLDVLSNDDSGIVDNSFKEVTAVCAVDTTDNDCTGNSYTDGIGTVSINGTGSDNNVLFNSNHNQSHTFEFKYLMQNSANNPGSGAAIVELAYIEVNSLTDNTVNGCDANQCSLREALTLAANHSEPSIINFKREMSGTVVLENGLTINSNDLSIIGPGAANIDISGNDLFRVFTIPSGTERFFLSGVTISHGQTPNQENGGGILIENALETRLENIRVIDNTASGSGGGIYAENAGLTLINSEISNNSSNNNGGGIGITGGFGSDVTIENSTISSNNASNTASSGMYIDTTFGQTTSLRFITAYNQGNVTDNQISGTGNIIIEASVFEPGLQITNSNNVTNNSIFKNLAGSVFGSNIINETNSNILKPSLVAINNSGLFGHRIDNTSVAYNHVDDMVGDASCGNQITSDQFGNSRPENNSCDAGAFEFSAIDIIFNNGFE